MKLRFTFILSFMGLIFLTQSYALDKQEISICIFPMPPLNFIDDEGAAQGLYPDLIREVVKEEDWKLSFVPGSWSECYERVASGSVDLITTIGFSSKRALIFDYNQESVADIWGRVYKRPDSYFSNISHLEGGKVAVARKDINGKNFIQTASKLGIEPVIIEYNSHDDVFRAIQKGDVLAGVVPQHFGFREAIKYDLVPSTIEFEPFSVYFAAKHGSQKDFLSHIDEHLKNWKKDPSSFYYKKINYWLGGKKESWIVPQWVYIIISVSAGGLFVLVLFNISLKREVRRRTKDLALTEKRFRALAETTKAVPWEFDLGTGKFSYVGPRIEELFGCPVDSWTDLKSWSDRINPSDRDQAIDLCMSETSKGRDHDFTYRAAHADGRTLWIHDIVSVQTGANGPERLIGYFVDISEQKRLQAQTIRSSQLASLGQLSAGVAHEINNPISGVINYADILKMRIEDPSHREILDRIILEGTRIAVIVKKLLSFSRDEKGEHQLHEVSMLIDDSLSLMEAQLGYDGIVVNKTIVEGLRPLKCNAHQIEQVLINLLSNARHALNKKYPEAHAKKKIDIDFSSVQSEDKHSVKIEVQDYGPGISEEVLPHLFTPFFTTKGVGAGTGLGLSICQDIISLHQGTLVFESEYGEYTTATIEIPYQSE